MSRRKPAPSISSAARSTSWTRRPLASDLTGRTYSQLEGALGAAYRLSELTGPRVLVNVYPVKPRGFVVRAHAGAQPPGARPVAGVIALPLES